MDGLTLSSAEWASLAKNEKAGDAFASVSLQRLKCEQVVRLNERGIRCRQSSCGGYVEFTATAWRRGRGKRPEHLWKAYVCFPHAVEFALSQGLEEPVRE